MTPKQVLNQLTAKGFIDDDGVSVAAVCKWVADAITQAVAAERNQSHRTELELRERLRRATELPPQFYLADWCFKRAIVHRAEGSNEAADQWLAHGVAHLNGEVAEGQS